MTLFTRSLWPERIRRPYLRLALALAGAPLLLAGLLTGIAFLVAGSSMATREATVLKTTDAAMAFFIFLPAFTLTFGLAGVVLLWWSARRGRLAWLLAGAIAGFAASLAVGLAAGSGAVPLQMTVASVLGLVNFLLIRALAGVRLS